MINMSRILVMGHELPGMAEGTIEARSYRTWQFVEPLLENGHQVCLIASHPKYQLNAAHEIHSSLTCHRLNFQERNWLRQADTIAEVFKADAVLAVMFNNGLRATRLASRRPLWIDLYGDRLTENQIAAHTRKSNRGLEISLEYLKLIARHADKYSTCSTPQKFAMVGQLGMASRLDRHTMGYEFVHPILPGASSKHDGGQPELIVRGGSVPQDAFIVLWSGGYNVWTDVDMLYQALDRAMEKDPRIHYVSAGAGVRLTNNNSYERFLEMIERSTHRDRFHMLGWQPSTVIPGLYRQADVGVNLDAFHYETLLGTRTRLVEMMHHGLPVITTLGCELSYIIENQGLGLTFPIGDAETFTEHMLALAKDRTLQQKLATQAQRYTNDRLSFQRTTEPFQEWAKKPGFAPDRIEARSRINFEEVANGLRTRARSLLWRLWALEPGD
jgi:glycosyltransferase involved in cell wall biosynthesis